MYDRETQMFDSYEADALMRRDSAQAVFQYEHWKKEMRELIELAESKGSDSAELFHVDINVRLKRKQPFNGDAFWIAEYRPSSKYGYGWYQPEVELAMLMELALRKVNAERACERNKELVYRRHDDGRTV